MMINSLIERKNIFLYLEILKILNNNIIYINVNIYFIMQKRSFYI